MIYEGANCLVETVKAFLKVLHRNLFTDIFKNLVEIFIEMFHRLTQSLGTRHEVNLIEDLPDLIFSFDGSDSEEDVEDESDSTSENDEPFYSYTFESIENEELNMSLTKLDISSSQPDNTVLQEWIIFKSEMIVLT